MSFTVLFFVSFHLFPAVLVHGQNLYHADENVQEVQLKRNALVDRVAYHAASLSHLGVVQNLLHIVQGEAAKDGETTIQPD